MTNFILDTKTGEVKNKIPDLSDLIKKTNYDAKISEFEEKYFTASDYKKFMSGILNVLITQKELVNKSDICSLEKVWTKTCNISNKRRIKNKAR